MSGVPDPFADTRPEPRQRWRVLAAVECGNFLVYMDAFVVTLSLPTLSRYFGVGLSEVRWVMIAYLATLTVTLLLAGRLADFWGRQRVTIAGMALLALGAGLSVLAPGLEALIVYRVIQGFGGALVLATVMAAITAVFPPGGPAPGDGDQCHGPGDGADHGTALWRLAPGMGGLAAVFVFLAILAAIGLVLDLAVLRRSALPAVPMDWWGGLLSIPLLGSPFLMIETFSRDLDAPTVGLFVTVAAALLGMFVVVEKRSARPLLELRLFRIRPFVCGSIAAALYFVTATSCYFLLPLYAQFILGLSPLSAGLLLVPLSVALTATSQLVGRLSHRFGARTISTAGLLCTSTAVLVLSTLGPTSTFAAIVGPVILIGIGGGLFHPPNNTAVLSGVPREHLTRRQRFLHDGSQLWPGDRGCAGGGVSQPRIGARWDAWVGSGHRLARQLCRCPGVGVSGGCGAGAGGGGDFGDAGRAQKSRGKISNDGGESGSFRSTASKKIPHSRVCQARTTGDVSSPDVVKGFPLCPGLQAKLLPDNPNGVDRRPKNNSGKALAEDEFDQQPHCLVTCIVQFLFQALARGSFQLVEHRHELPKSFSEVAFNKESHRRQLS